LDLFEDLKYLAEIVSARGEEKQNQIQNSLNSIVFYLFKDKGDRPINLLRREKEMIGKRGRGTDMIHTNE